MPRELERELQTLLSTPGGAPYASWVELILPEVPSPETGKDGLAFQLATQAIKVEGVICRVELKSIGDIVRSVDRQVARAQFSLQNVTTAWGALLLGDADLMQGGSVRLGRWWKHPGTLAEFTKQYFTGVVEGASGDEKIVTIDVLSDIFAVLSIGGGRLAERSCQAVYNSPYLRSIGSTLGEACAYAGELAGCNKLLDDPNGCVGHFGSLAEARKHYQGAAETSGKAALSDAAGLSKQKNYQLVRADDDTTQPMRTALKIVGATLSDDEENDQTVLTITPQVSAKDLIVTFEKGADALEAGTDGPVVFPVDISGEFIAWEVYSMTDDTGSIVFELEKVTPTYPVTSAPAWASMIGGGNAPALSSQIGAAESVSGWDDAAFASGDLLRFSIVSASDLSNVALTIKYNPA